MLIPILSHTSSSFVDHMYARLGRGKIQALELYKQFVRRGSLIDTPPSFLNAPLLFEEMKGLVDARLDPIVQMMVDPESETKKLLLKTHDGHTIESVFLLMKHKRTICISSQIGCCRGCVFCQTGKMGLQRNLEAKEIVGQVLQGQLHSAEPISNVVFMGMGEPLDNFEEVLKAFHILIDPDGFSIGRKNCTLSTSGHVPGIEKLARMEGEIPNLALSLNAAVDDLRSQLMPINRQFGLPRLKEALQLFTRERKREILIAYVLLEGINDSKEHEEALLRFVEDLPVKINIISYNAQEGAIFRPSSLAVEERFVARLRRSGHRVLVRRTKGERIMAACGQLGRSVKKFE